MRLFITIILITITCIAQAQNEHFVPKDKWSENLYIPDDFCAKYGLEPGETNNLLKAWNNLKDDAAFARIVDIRWYFSSPEDAVKYLSENKAELSEKGDPVIPGFRIPDAEHIMAFHDGAGFLKLNGALGLTSHMYIFLFTEKNYLAKVFVSSEKDISCDKAGIFAIEAARRLHAAIQ